MAVAPGSAPIPTLADVERLVRLDVRATRIPSVYLDLDPARHATRSCRIVFRDLVKFVRDDLEAGARRALAAEVDTVEEWLASDPALYPDAPMPCPMCGAQTLPLGDIADRAAELTIVQDGEVEIAHDGAAGRLRERCDGMGALLHFRLQP
jgi:hypothetical protein